MTIFVAVTAKAENVPSFEMSLWKPFQNHKTMIVIPRISLRDSWQLNSEEVKLLLGPLKFLELGVVDEDSIVRLIDKSYADKHLIVLGAPHLDAAELDISKYQNDRTVHHLMLNKLREKLPDDFKFKLYRTLSRGKTASKEPGKKGPQDIATSGITFGDLDPDSQTTEEDGRVSKDVGLIVRMRHPNRKELKALWAFGYTAPGTRAALEKRTQVELSKRINEKELDDFAALFEVEITYRTDLKNENYAELSDVFFRDFQPLT